MRRVLDRSLEPRPPKACHLPIRCDFVKPEGMRVAKCRSVADQARQRPECGALAV